MPLLRTRVFSLLLAGLVLQLLPSLPARGANHEQGETLLQFQIRRQALATALLDFSYQSNIQVLMPGYLAEGMIAPAVSGEYTAEQVLQKLLARTGLEYRFSSEHTVTIAPKADESDISARRKRWLDRYGGEQMFVIARKRRAPIRDITSSKAALSGEELQSRGVSKADELQLFVPSLTVEAPDSGNTEFSIRAAGISNDDLSTHPGVAVLIDDVYVPRQSAANMALYELDQVEVLRGPQSVLSARNATGGALRYTTLKPTSEFEAYYGVDIGEQGTFNNQLAVNGALSEHVSARAALVSFERDPIMENRANAGADGNNIDSVAGRATFKVEASDSVEWLWSMDAEQTVQDAILYSIGPENGFRFVEGFPAVPASDPKRSASVDVTEQEKLDVFGSMLRANVDADSYSASYILGYRAHDLQGAYDLDHSAAMLAAKSVSESSRFSSFEARWESAEKQYSQPVVGDLFWLFGLHLSTEKADLDKRFHVPGLGAGLNFWQQVLEDQSYSAYGQLDYTLSQRLSVSLGLRYVADFREFDLSANSTVASINNPYIQESIIYSRRHDWRQLTPRVAIHYQYSPETSLYASFSTAHKPGGYNGMPGNNVDVQQLFRDEAAKSMEAGLRSSWFASRVKFNMALFFSEFRDMQVMDQDRFGKNFVDNAELAEVNGFELEVQARPLAALNISMGWSFVDAEFKKYLFFRDHESGLEAVNKVGDPLPRIPDSTFNLSAAYLFSDSDTGSWSLRADAAYSDEAVDIYNDLAWSDYRIYNLWLDYLPHNGRWEAAVWVRNLRDKLNFRATAPGVSAGQLALARKLDPPRLAGLSFKYYW